MIKDFDIHAVTEDYLSDMKSIMKSASRDWSVGILMTCFGKDYQQWGIFFEGMLLGFLIIKKNDHAWELIQIMIDKNYQAQGLARRLLQFMVAEAQKSEIKKIQLEVRQSNVIAIHLYLSVGFKEVGVRKKYYGGVEDALLMDFVM